MWKSKVAESIFIIKNYMALNHYKLTLILKAFRQLKALGLQRAAVEMLVGMFRQRMETALGSIAQATSKQALVCDEYRDYRSRVLQSAVLREWHSHTVKHKIAKMFFKRKYLRAFSDLVFATQHQRPAKHYQQRLMVIAFFTLRDFKLQRWQKERTEIFNRAVLGKYTTSLKRKCLSAIINAMISAKKKRIVASTIREFKSHSLTQKAVRVWKLFVMVRRRKRLLL
jgi:hypothetical protein